MADINTDRNAVGPPAEDSKDPRDPVPGMVDWFLGVLTGIIGLALTVVGFDLFNRVDRALIADVVANEEVRINGLTESEFVSAAGPFVDWLAIGLAVTGLVLVVGAAVFVATRRRTRRRLTQEGGTTATFRACTVYGAAVTAVASVVVPIVPAVAGGGAAAYLHRGDSGARVGTMAGLLGWALTLPLLAFGAIGVIEAAGAIGRSSAGVLLAALWVGAELVVLTISAAFGGLGGFLVDRFF